MEYIVSTQHLENYGAHSEDGRFINGNARWKFKGGDDYHVIGLEREADAVAFVHAYINRKVKGVDTNTICFKEYVCGSQPYHEWFDDVANIHTSEYAKSKADCLIKLDVEKIYEVN